MLRNIFSVVILSAHVCTLCSAYCDYYSGSYNQGVYCYYDHYAKNVNVFAIISGSTIAGLIVVTVISLAISLICCLCIKHKGHTVTYTSVPTMISVQRQTDTQMSGPSGVSANVNQGHLAVSTTVPMTNEQASGVQPTGLPNSNTGGPPAASSSTVHQNMGFSPE